MPTDQEVAEALRRLKAELESPEFAAAVAAPLPASTLTIRSPGAEPYPLDVYELADAIRAEADTIAADAGSELLAEDTEAEREALAANIVTAATAALREPGDSYRDPTGITWHLT